MKRKDSKTSEHDAPKVKPVRVACPKTSSSFTVEFRNDADWLAKYWHETVIVRCPNCGGKHAYGVKSIYLSEAIADNPTSQDLFAA